MKSLTAFLTIALFSAGLATARAQHAQAALAQESAAVGQPVQLNISVTGARGVRVPERISVEGLDIRLAGQSEQTQVTMTNGRLNAVTSAVYTYMIIPVKPGTFTIPAQTIQVSGQTLQTQPLTLTVGGAPGGVPSTVPVLPALPVPHGSAPGQPPLVQPHTAVSEGEIAWGEIIIPRKSAFVGEVVPIEIRYFFNSQYRVRLQDKPSFSGDGFTVMNLSQPTQGEQEINGQTYNVVTFQTAITPAKSGTLEITPAKIESRIQMPSSRQGDDFFGNFFGSMDEREVAVETKPISLEVKSLPKDGRPEEFSGAIGQFSIKGAASPKKAEAGEPVSLHVTVSGRGNFGGMGAPTLVNDDGWRTYPPTEKFTPSPSDPIGYMGDKNFEFMLVARQDRSSTPVAEFTYFDPSVEKYVTLKTAAFPIVARGGAAPAPSPAVTSTPPAATPAAAQPEPETAADHDVLARKFLPARFEPFGTTRTFLVANGAIAAVWLVGLLFGLGRVVSGSASARQAAARRANRNLLRQMQPSSCAPEKFYELAAAFVTARLESANRDALENAAVRPETRDAVAAILDAHDALKYSTAGGSSTLSPEDRRRMVAQLKAFDEELH